MFWENFVSLCNQKGISPNGVCADLGMSNATATKWKNGAIPRATTARKIADYFGISVSSLLGVEDDSVPIVPNKKTSMTLNRLEKLMQDMTEEELEELERYAEFILFKKILIKNKE